MSRVLCNTKYLQLKSTIYNDNKEWVYAHRANVDNVVVVLPETEEEVLFLIEKRPPIEAENLGKYSIAVPAGLVGDVRENETIEEAIASELLEETGLKACSINIHSRKVASSPGCVSETVVLASAKIKDKTLVSEPINDDGVIIDRIWVKKDLIKEWLKDKEQEGFIITAQTLAVLFYL